MMTPARKHRLQVSAAQEAAKAEADSPMAHATGYELMLAKLHADKRRLKDVQSIERKAEVKREILPDYMPYCLGVLEAGRGGPDEVLMTCMVWAIDAGQNFYRMALDIAAHAIRHRLPMPDQYQRTTGCLLAEEFADSALKSMTAGQPADMLTLMEVGVLTKDEDMPDEVRAKLYKAMGYALRESGNDTGALEHLRRAYELFDKVGVKKDIEVLERKLSKP